MFSFKLYLYLCFLAQRQPFSFTIISSFAGTSSSAQAEEDALSALISKDIDLRKLPLQLIPNTSVVEHGGDKQHDSSRTMPSAIAPARADIQLNDSSNRRSSTDAQEMDEYAGGKKRSSTAKTEEPMAKKSKAEMIDA